MCISRSFIHWPLNERSGSGLRAVYEAFFFEDWGWVGEINMKRNFAP